jgi:thiamine biosynthesis lipoprotein
MTAVDHAFRALGTQARLILDEAPGTEPAAQLLERALAWLAAFDRCASRFRPDSELTALNADPRAAVPASPLLRTTVEAGLWAARRTGGLVDPVLADALERAGYAAPWDPAGKLDVAQALRHAPPRNAARPDPAGRWQQVRVFAGSGTIARPPGLHLDTGGTGKGLAADALAALAGERRAVVDLGGDLALRRPGGDDEPFAVEVAHPLSGETTHTLLVHGGGVATSGIDARLWEHEGAPAHHLLDPSTGRSAWTGLISVTALAPTALEAEVLAKAALLSGPDHAAEWLAEHGGLLVHDDGAVRLTGALAEEVLAA